MSVTLLHKKSATPGDTPTTGQLTLGEIALNTYDGKAFFKKNDGTAAVVTLSVEGHSHTISNITGLQTALNGKLATSGKAADSNLLDGIDSSQFLRSDASDQYYRISQTPHGNPINNLGDPSVTEMALFQEQFDNKTSFYDINYLKFYTSTDGTNWTEYTSFSDAHKRRFVGGDYNSGINIPYNTPYFRIEVANAGSYAYLNALYMYWSGKGNTTTVKIRKQRCDGVWSQHTNSTAGVGSWPGHLYLPFGTIPFHPSTTSTGHYRTIHIDFQPTWSTTHTNHISLYRMQLWGGYPAGKRTHFTVDENKQTIFPSEVYANGSTAYKVFHDGYHPNADKLTTARTISLTGDVSGSTSFDGSGNVSITATIADDSHNHVISNVDGLQSALDGKQNTDASIMKHRGSITNQNWNTYVDGTEAGIYSVVNMSGSNAPPTYPYGIALSASVSGQGKFQLYAPHNGSEGGNGLYYRSGWNTDYDAWAEIWHSRNDGSGSGLDADRLDGQQGSYYQNASNLNAGTINDARLPASISSNITGNAATATKLATARSIALSGDVTGSANFDGSANISITATVADDSHNHVISNVDGLQSALDGKLSSGTILKDLNNNTSNTRDKLRVWSNSTYTIGMQNSITFGALNNDYGMTFQMSNTSSRGFWWGDTGHSTAQGAMSLSTNGKLTVAHSVRMGYGESDTSVPGGTYRLDVRGKTRLAGSVYINDYIYHNGDTNSYMGFGAGDDFRIVAGGRELVRLDEGTDPDTAQFMSSQFQMTSAGNFTAAGNITSNSDERLKENIRPIDNALDMVLRMDGRRYVKDGKQSIGVIAQEIEDILPEVVHQGVEYKAVAYGNIVAVLIEAIKELANGR